MEGNGNKDMQKSPVKIRFKAMKNGYRSIYLDCYHGGRRSYEYLKLYLVPETDDKTARQNTAAMRQAEAVLKIRLCELKKQLPVNKRLEPKEVPQNDLILSDDSRGAGHGNATDRLAARLSRCAERCENHRFFGCLAPRRLSGRGISPL